jgi:hypothetical protein
LKGCFDIPFAKTRVQIHNRLATIDLPKAGSICMQHFVRGLWQESSDVDVGNTFAVLKAFCKRHFRRVSPHGGNGPGDRRFLLSEALQVLEHVAVWGLHHLVREAWLRKAVVVQKGNGGTIYGGDSRPRIELTLVARSFRGGLASYLLVLASDPSIPLLASEILCHERKWISLHCCWRHRKVGTGTWIHGWKIRKVTQLVWSKDRSGIERGNRRNAIQHWTTGKEDELAIVGCTIGPR